MVKKWKQSLKEGHTDRQQGQGTPHPHGPCGSRRKGTGPCRKAGLGWGEQRGGGLQSGPAGSTTWSLINIPDVRGSSELVLNSKHLEEGSALPHLSAPL